ncbi:hypothetical protein JTE90_015279 [Oedothorax gibbosus]|uniref:Inorganic phosphate cotransporter n=1 Tax=Oedothorax gibbosus TaxID=931172 RepID=A0AAV6UEH9_9ARAC|nr:hypothetical protein JTE90_015279 [Oedothorax gibbosus]
MIYSPAFLNWWVDRSMLATRPACFYLFGLFGCLWFFLWAVLITDTPQTHPFITKKELKYITSNQKIETNKKLPPVPWRKIACSIPFWSLIVTQTCQDWSYYTIMTDLPTYFATMLHFRIETNGFLSSIPHFLQTIVGLVVSSVTDLIVRRGLASPQFVRKFCNSVSGFGTSLGLVAVCLSGCDVNKNVALFMFSVAIGGFCYSGHELTLLDLSPEYAGTLYGIANTISNLTGFLTPLVVGALTDGNQTLGQWHIVFGITSGLLAFASVVFVIFSTTQKQDWAVTSPAIKDVTMDVPECSSINRKAYKRLT